MVIFKHWLKFSFLFLGMTLISCDYSTIAENQPDSSEKGIIPKDHAIYDAKGYDELIATYKTSLQQDKGKHYFQNLRNYCIFKLLATDFYNQSTQKDRLFIANELAELKYATPNIDNFYALVMYLLENDKIDIDQAKSLSNTFETKNKKNIKKVFKAKPEQRQKKLNKIDKGRTEILLFERQQRMLKKRKEFESN